MQDRQTEKPLTGGEGALTASPGTDLTSGGSMRKRATMMPSCSSMRRKAMMSWAQADMKRGFLVQIFFLLPARIRAMRFVWGLIAKHHQNLPIIHAHTTYCVVNPAKTPWLQGDISPWRHTKSKKSQDHFCCQVLRVSTAHYFHNNSGQTQERP